MLQRIRQNISKLFHAWWDVLPHPIRRLLKVGSGLFFLVLGIIGIFIPIMPQIPFLLLSLTLLSSESSRARNLLRRMKRWLAQQRRALRRRKNHGR
ncbi:MAG: DUF454 domain-containing protein [Deltaproteobacteria bacterium]|nr:DUF454 domain-containing protein [Deltaproteobacteria bacterium]